MDLLEGETGGVFFVRLSFLSSSSLVSMRRDPGASSSDHPSVELLVVGDCSALRSFGGVGSGSFEDFDVNEKTEIVSFLLKDRETSVE